PVEDEAEGGQPPAAAAREALVHALAVVLAAAGAEGRGGRLGLVDGRRDPAIQVVEVLSVAATAAGGRGAVGGIGRGHRYAPFSRGCAALRSRNSSSMPTTRKIAGIATIGVTACDMTPIIVITTIRTMTPMRILRMTLLSHAVGVSRTTMAEPAIASTPTISTSRATAGGKPDRSVVTSIMPVTMFTAAPMNSSHCHRGRPAINCVAMYATFPAGPPARPARSRRRGYRP